jgi:hypothetical protein
MNLREHVLKALAYHYVASPLIVGDTIGEDKSTCGRGYVRMIKKVDRTTDPKYGAMVELSGGFEKDCKCDGTCGYVTTPVILDPFAGSGTTMLAANMLGRDFVGSELDPRFVAKFAPARAALGNAAFKGHRIGACALPLP